MLLYSNSPTIIKYFSYDVWLVLLGVVSICKLSVNLYKFACQSVKLYV